jgi:hypothetical protein
MRQDLSSRIPIAPPPRTRSSLSPIDRVLSYVAVALIAAGTFLGVSKHGQPLVPRARELFVPGGLVLLVIAWRSRRRQPVASIWIGLVGLALIGVGAHEAVAGPWTLLAVPGTALGCLACLRSVARGSRDPLFERVRWARRFGVRSKPRSLAVTRAWLVFAALMLAFGVGFGVAGALPAGPTVDVEVVPVAYGGDPAAGVPPGVFGLGVRQAHCSGGATAYTLAVHGASYKLSCATSTGRRPRIVTIGLSPGQSYPVTITPIRPRAGRSPRLGTERKLTARIPDPNSKNWEATP